MFSDFSIHVYCIAGVLRSTKKVCSITFTMNTNNNSSTVCNGEDYLEHFNEKAYLREFHTDVFNRTDQIADLWQRVVKRLNDTFKDGMVTTFLQVNVFVSLLLGLLISNLSKKNINASPSLGYLSGWHSRLWFYL